MCHQRKSNSRWVVHFTIIYQMRLMKYALWLARARPTKKCKVFQISCSTCTPKQEDGKTCDIRCNAEQEWATARPNIIDNIRVHFTYSTSCILYLYIPIHWQISSRWIFGITGWAARVSFEYSSHFKSVVTRNLTWGLKITLIWSQVRCCVGSPWFNSSRSKIKQ